MTVSTPARGSAASTRRLRYRDRAMYLPDDGTLVLADLHLGRGRRSTVDAPLDAAIDLVGRLRELCAHFDPDRVVLAGDILDSFDRVPAGVTDRFHALVDTIEEGSANPILLAGNHDPQLAALFDGDVDEEVVVGDTLICHGHRLPSEQAARYVIGHEHPALRVAGVKHSCALVGPLKARDATVVVLPAFSPLLRGTAVKSLAADRCHSPVLQGMSIGRSRPIVWDPTAEEALTFPTLEQLAAVE